MNSRDLMIVLGVVFAAIVLLPILGMSMWGTMMMGWRPGWMGGFGLLALLFVIAGVALVVHKVSHREPSSDDPLQTLKRRLAAGEITKEQYEELRQIVLKRAGTD